MVTGNPAKSGLENFLPNFHPSALFIFVFIYFSTFIINDFNLYLFMSKVILLFFYMSIFSLFSSFLA